MSDIPVNCPHCGKEFSVTSDLGGLLATCPYCSRQVTVPVTEEQMQKRSGLQIKRPDEMAGARRCPACGVSLLDGAVICVKCGFDLRTGKRVSMQIAHNRTLQILLLAMGVIIIVMLAKSVFMDRKGGEPIQVLPAVTSEQASVSMAASNVAPSMAVVVTSAPVSGAVSATGTPATAEAEASLANTAEMQRLYAQQLDRRSPMFVKGESIALRRANGMMHRGFFIGVQGTNAVLLAGKERIEVPLAVLDQPSRIRSDEAYRKKWVEYVVRKRMAGEKSP